MIWFWVVVLVVIIGAAAVIAAGRGDAMADVYEDRPDVTLERGHPLTAADVAKVRFTTAVRGYRMDEVDAFVARIDADLRAREAVAADESTTVTDDADQPAAVADDQPADGSRDATGDSQAERPEVVSGKPATTAAPGRRRAGTYSEAVGARWRSVGGKRRAGRGAVAAPETSTDGNDQDTSR